MYKIRVKCSKKTSEDWKFRAYHYSSSITVLFQGKKINSFFFVIKKNAMTNLYNVINNYSRAN